jgi:hypothetical protein
MKRISIFLVLLMAGFAINIFQGSPDAAESGSSVPGITSPENKSDTTATVPKVIAYYFHTTVRCPSCKKIEAYSKEAIETGFAEELKKGILQFQSINVEEGVNKHFIKDYQLYTKSVIICDMENGKQTEWKNLTRVWQLISRKDEFVKYVQDEIKDYLKEN